MCIASFKRTLVLLFALIGLAATISSAADYPIAHVTVINPGRGKPRRDMTIVIHEDRNRRCLTLETIQTKVFRE